MAVGQEQAEEGAAAEEAKVAVEEARWRPPRRAHSRPRPGTAARKLTSRCRQTRGKEEAVNVGRGGGGGEEWVDKMGKRGALFLSLYLPPDCSALATIQSMERTVSQKKKQKKNPAKRLTHGADCTVTNGKKENQISEESVKRRRVFGSIPLKQT